MKITKKSPQSSKFKGDPNSIIDQLFYENNKNNASDLKLIRKDILKIVQAG